MHLERSIRTKIIIGATCLSLGALGTGITGMTNLVKDLYKSIPAGLKAQADEYEQLDALANQEKKTDPNGAKVIFASEAYIKGSQATYKITELNNDFVGGHLGESTGYMALLLGGMAGTLFSAGQEIDRRRKEKKGKPKKPTRLPPGNYGMAWKKYH